jgi:hypothetical protein
VIPQLISNSDIVKAAHLQPISKAELAELSRKKTNHNFAHMQLPERASSSHAALQEKLTPQHISMVTFDLFLLIK